MQTHNWTFIHPTCGKPAMHSTHIPRSAGGLAPAELELMGGEPMPTDRPMRCWSCCRELDRLDFAAMTVEANWRRREEAPAWCPDCTPDNCVGCNGRFASMSRILPPLGSLGEEA